MIKYLHDRECPKCRSRVIVMLVRFSSQISTISGICNSCDYAMKWLSVRGNATGARNTDLPREQATIQV